MNIVTVSILKENGYPIGNMKDDNSVVLAENNIKEAYFPTDELFEDESVKQLLYALTFSMLLKRKTVASRYGSVTKTSQYTIQADEKQVKEEIRGYCRLKLEAYLLTQTDFEPQDVLEIYTKMFLI